MSPVSENNIAEIAAVTQNDYIVYVGIFTDLGKAYVGISHMGPTARIAQHVKKSSNVRVRNLTRQGYKAVWTIIESGLSEQEAVLREDYHVAEYRKTHKVLNIAKPGGLGSTQRKARKIAEERGVSQRENLKDYKIGDEERWLVQYGGADPSNSSDRASGFLRNSGKCGRIGGNLSVIGVKTSGNATILNSYRCNDTACFSCSKILAAKTTNETRIIIENAFNEGQKVAFCVLTKASPCLDLFAEMEAAKSSDDKEEKVWKKWERHIGYSIHVATRARQLLGNWHRSLPEKVRPSFGIFPEVVFPFNQPTGGRKNFFHAHLHFNILWFFPKSMTIEDISNFRSELYRRWAVSVKTAFTEKKDANEDAMVLDFEHYRNMLSSDPNDRDLYTNKSAFYFKVLNSEGVPVTDEDADLKIDKDAKINAVRDLASATALEAASSVTKVGRQESSSVNQFGLNQFINSEDEWLKTWAARTKVSWLRMSSKKMVNAQWSRVGGKRLPDAMGTACIELQKCKQDEFASIFIEAKGSKTSNSYKYKTADDFSEDVSSISSEDWLFYKKESRAVDSFLIALTIAKRRIFQLERYRLAGWDWNKTQIDSRIAKTGLKSIKKHRQIIDWTPNQMKFLFRDQKFRVTLAGLGLEQFVKAAMLAADLFDKRSKRVKYDELLSRNGGKPRQPMVTFVGDVRGWPELSKDQLDAWVKETLQEIQDMNASAA